MMLSYMHKTLIRWKLKEVMARYDITGVALAQELGVSNNTISSLRRAKTMPRLDGDQLDVLLSALNLLAKDKDDYESISHVTLIDYIPGALPPNKTSKPFAHNKRQPIKQKKSDSDDSGKNTIGIDKRKIA